MADFDSVDYRKRVLKAWSSEPAKRESLKRTLQELKRDAGSQAFLELDLNELFGVPTPATGVDLAAHEKALMMALNKGGSAGVAPQVKELWALCSERADVRSAAFWDGLGQKVQAARGKQLDAMVEALVGEFALGVVPKSQLDRTLEAKGLTSLPREIVQKALKLKGLQVVDDLVELPAVPPAVRQPYAKAMEYADFRTVMDLVLYETNDQPVSFVDGLRSGGRPVGTAELEGSRTRAKQGKDTNALQAAQKFLGAMVKQCLTSGELHQIVLACIAHQTGGELNRGVPQVMVRDDLVGRGLDRTDVSRVILALRESGSAQAALGLDEVRRLLAERRPTEARSLLTGITPSPEEAADHASLLQQAERLLQDKAQHLATARAARDAHDLVTASREVDAASAIDPYDPAVEQLRESIPPPPPSRVTVQAQRAGARVQWAGVSGTDVQYRVVRSSHPITHESDGDVLATGLRAELYDDASAPVATPLWYAVLATRDGHVYSAPTTGEVTLLPPVADARVQAERDSVQVSWKRPPDAVLTRVTCLPPQGSARTEDVTRGSSVAFSGLGTGATHHIEIRAMYRVGAHLVSSEAVRLTAVPRSVAQPVRDLKLIADADATEQVAEWTGPVGYDVELWTFPVGRDPEVGSTLSRDALISVGGQRVTATTLPGRGGTSRARVRPDAGIRCLVPVVVQDSSLLVGTSVLLGSVEAPSDVHSELLDGQVQVSWRWPAGVHLAELRWKGNGISRTRRVTDVRYRAEGGAHVAVDGTEDLTVCCVASLDEVELTSARIPVRIPCRTPYLEYTLHCRKSLFGNHQWSLTATCDQPVLVEADLVQAMAQWMPNTASDGHLVQHLSIDFSAGPFETTVEVPRTKQPYWMRLFAGPGVAVVDPPNTSDMKA